MQLVQVLDVLTVFFDNRSHTKLFKTSSSGSLELTSIISMAAVTRARTFSMLWGCSQCSKMICVRPRIRSYAVIHVSLVAIRANLHDCSIDRGMFVRTRFATFFSKFGRAPSCVKRMNTVKVRLLCDTRQEKTFIFERDRLVWNNHKFVLSSTDIFLLFSSAHQMFILSVEVQHNKFCFEGFELFCIQVMMKQKWLAKR